MWLEFSHAIRTGVLHGEKWWPSFFSSAPRGMCHSSRYKPPLAGRGQAGAPPPSVYHPAGRLPPSPRPQSKGGTLEQGGAERLQGGCVSVAEAHLSSMDTSAVSARSSPSPGPCCPLQRGRASLGLRGAMATFPRTPEEQLGGERRDVGVTGQWV